MSCKSSRRAHSRTSGQVQVRMMRASKKMILCRSQLCLLGGLAVITGQWWTSFFTKLTKWIIVVENLVTLSLQQEYFFSFLGAAPALQHRFIDHKSICCSVDTLTLHTVVDTVPLTNIIEFTSEFKASSSSLSPSILDATFKSENLHTNWST